jgi:hypothetical protein
MLTTRKLAVATGVASLALAGAAASASAYQVYPNATAATPWADGTPYTATAGALQFANLGGTTIANCTGGSVTGAVSDGSTALSVGAGSSFTGCTVAGAPVFVTVNPTWKITALSGTSPTFEGQAAGVNVTVRCGTPTATPATYAGTLTSLTGNPASGSFQINNDTTGSTITLNKAGLLDKTGTGCPTLPNPARVTVSYKAATVNGAAVTATNNLWVK